MVNETAGQIHALFLLLLLITTCPVIAAFTWAAQWKLDTIENTFAGTCFRPGPDTLVRECTNATLKALIEVHTKIAYYDPKDGSIL